MQEAKKLQAGALTYLILLYQWESGDNYMVSTSSLSELNDSTSGTSVVLGLTDMREEFNDTLTQTKGVPVDLSECGVINETVTEETMFATCHLIATMHMRGTVTEKNRGKVTKIAFKFFSNQETARKYIKSSGLWDCIGVHDCPVFGPDLKEPSPKGETPAKKLSTLLSKFYTSYVDLQEFWAENMETEINGQELDRILAKENPLPMCPYEYIVHLKDWLESVEKQTGEEIKLN